MLSRVVANVDAEQAVVGSSVIDFILEFLIEKEKQPQVPLRYVFVVYLLPVVQVVVVAARGIWRQLWWGNNHYSFQLYPYETITRSTLVDTSKLFSVGVTMYSR